MYNLEGKSRARRLAASLIYHYQRGERRLSKYVQRGDKGHEDPLFSGLLEELSSIQFRDKGPLFRTHLDESKISTSQISM